MKQEIYQDGKHKLTIQSTDGDRCDLVTLPKLITKEASMSPRGFDELFFCFLGPGVTHVEAYEKAENVHQRYFDKPRYSDYDSFRKSKEQRLKK